MCYRVLLHLIVLVSIIRCHIFRSPCAHNGHFVPKHGWKSSAQVLETYQNVNKRSCALKCIFNDACFSINHKNKDGGACELLIGGTEGNVDADWSFYTTASDNTKVGPLCEGSSKCTNYCRDVCNNNIHTYVCLDSLNAALQGMASIAHLKDDRHASNLIDGNYNTITHSDSGYTYIWVKIDLRYTFYIHSMRLYPRIIYPQRSKNMDIRGSLDDTEYHVYGRTVPTLPYSEYAINAFARFVELRREPTTQSIFDGVEIELYV